MCTVFSYIITFLGTGACRSGPTQPWEFKLGPSHLGNFEVLFGFGFGCALPITYLTLQQLFSFFFLSEM